MFELKAFAGFDFIGGTKEIVKELCEILTSGDKPINSRQKIMH